MVQTLESKWLYFGTQSLHSAEAELDAMKTACASEKLIFLMWVPELTFLKIFTLSFYECDPLTRPAIPPSGLSELIRLCCSLIPRPGRVPGMGSFLIAQLVFLLQNFHGYPESKVYFLCL